MKHLLILTILLCSFSITCDGTVDLTARSQIAKESSITRKPFDESEYANCDSIAKQAVKNYLANKGYYVTIKQEKCGVDIYAMSPSDVVSWHEVEIKKVWTGEWPGAWNTVHIPERKSRLLKKGHPNLFFWVLSADLSQAWLIKHTVLSIDLLKEIHNCKVPDAERFFCVPITLCKLVILNLEGNKQ